MSGLSGIYLRVLDEDANKYIARCFEDCTEEQQDEWLETLDTDALKRTIKLLGTMLLEIDHERME